ncbi:hypothetical protein TTSV1_gp07 [Thermoproteus tenax spherical virus 1]|uniref:Uncharacterized protein n=1 Tax=Thermoproteus tenax spherical virus 1 TaxID=292639 RepID=Q647F5_9VIRU|nr:hypothetical protein TTSV1_gp07 [Thermoproteus tenax spherical virus 1]AAU25957.1 hypothetical protein [Thermoproteus tenax spherical virus 1]
MTQLVFVEVGDHFILYPGDVVAIVADIDDNYEGDKAWARLISKEVGVIRNKTTAGQLKAAFKMNLEAYGIPVREVRVFLAVN